MSGAAGFEPKILAYVCNGCTYLGADLAGTARLEYPPNVRIVRLPCTGRIDTNLVAKAFEAGSDAVLVSGCHPGDCHYYTRSASCPRSSRGRRFQLPMPRMSDVYTSLENRMKCGIGKCGRCNAGPVYVCKEGPVFSLEELRALPMDY